MKVGYISELCIKGYGKDFSNCIDKLVNISKNENLDYLVISGGISNNYNITLKFVSDLGSVLNEFGTGLRFVAGNSDFYYSDENIVDKEKKFRQILSTYRENRYYLPYNPILTRTVRIVGAETWYDYSLYRGKPRDLRDISKKRILFFRNKDNKYITNESDYTLGLNNTFDIRYSKECAYSLKNELESHNRKHGRCIYNIVVTYLKTSKIFLGNSFIDKYMGTFEGSSVYHDIMKNNLISDCVFGKHSDREDSIIDGIRYKCSSGKVRVEDYGN